MVNKIRPSFLIEMLFAQNNHCKFISESAEENIDYCPSPSQTDHGSLAISLFTGIVTVRMNLQGNTVGAEDLTSEDHPEFKGFATALLDLVHWTTLTAQVI